ncbi:MAG: hypothetical protein GY900_14070 [Actinomycetia bacterium]|nr:hypothetical protein [Actinomycetes bacterium]
MSTNLRKDAKAINRRVRCQIFSENCVEIAMWTETFDTLIFFIHTDSRCHPGKKNDIEKFPDIISTATGIDKKEFDCLYYNHDAEAFPTSEFPPTVAGILKDA